MDSDGICAYVCAQAFAPGRAPALAPAAPPKPPPLSAWPPSAAPSRPLDGVDRGQQQSALSITQYDDGDFIDWPAFRENPWIPSPNPSANSSN
ncbi:hypothetical protein CYMTET_28441 [Cymbomonas tetramitiformis]|uniref:Uncharacterized protein n=1 Tax=Cymbomonas tetramitiformis TaxID=36881 RepID=A0AAE0FPC7_9CHLO|nr:hypothetical protein CYMTET_28441 [Cymbomonas tetramitiformis]